MSQADLYNISKLTLDHYRQRAEAFREGTRDHDVSQNIDALLRHLTQGIGVEFTPAGDSKPQFKILDFGCGPGRDLKTFTALGHIAVGLDGAAEFVTMARAASDGEVWLQDFLSLDLPSQYFDGIFANASLFHVPCIELPRVLQQLNDTLKIGGVLFSSNPRGDSEEGWNNGRYGVFHSLEAWRRYMTAANFIELEHYYRPTGLPFEQQHWLASVWRKAVIQHNTEQFGK